MLTYTLCFALHFISLLLVLIMMSVAWIKGERRAIFFAIGFFVLCFMVLLSLIIFGAHAHSLIFLSHGIYFVLIVLLIFIGLILFIYFNYTARFKRHSERLLAISGISSTLFNSNFIRLIHGMLDAKYSIAINYTIPHRVDILFCGKDGESLVCPASLVSVLQPLIEDVQKETFVYFDNSCGRHYMKDLVAEMPGLSSIAGKAFSSPCGNVRGVLLVVSESYFYRIRFFREIIDMFCVRLSIEVERDSRKDDILLAKQRLDSLVKNTPLGVIYLDENFDVVQWNASCEKIFGYSCSDMLGQKIMNRIVPASEYDDVKQYWDDLKSNPSDGYCLNKNITARGREIICEWYITPIIDDDGKLLSVASLILDVTEWHRAIDTLLKSQQEQKDSLDALIDAVIIIDESGIIQRANKAVMDVFGYESFELIGKNVSCLMLEKESLVHDGSLLKYLQSGDGGIINVGREVLGKQKRGDTIPIRLTISELPSGIDGKRRFIGACHNLTLVKKQEEIIRRAQKLEAVGKLTSAVAHDFNNLLGIIQGYSELLKLKLKADKKTFDYADQIHMASLRGSNLTQKLLSISKKNSISPMLFDAREAIDANEHFIRSLIPKRIALKLEISSEACFIFADKNDLNEAVLNICINAMHAISGEGEICIRLHVEYVDETTAFAVSLPIGRYVLLEIADTGCGMGEAVLEKIFDPFYTTKGDDGTGIGLSQVYAFVDRSNGSIRVNSRLGVGSEFSLRFPLADHDSTPGSHAVVSDSESDLNPKSVLVVDDESSLRLVASDMLSDVGYRVFLAGNADEALHILSAEQIDVVLSDVIMSGMDGFELCKTVKRLYPAIQTIIASGYLGDGFDLSNVDKSLHSSIIRKPYSRSELLAAIEKALQSRGV